jgi:hypothetical protein
LNRKLGVIPNVGAETEPGAQDLHAKSGGLGRRLRG